MTYTSALPAEVVPGSGVRFSSPAPTTVYLSGSSNPHTRYAARFTSQLGLLVTYRNRYLKQVRAGHYRIWAADNGVYSKHPWDETRWWQWVNDLPRGTGRCLFVNAPDVLYDAAATLEAAAGWLPRIRAVGFPAGLVAQDGVEDLLTDAHWESFDALFIGGTDAWKDSHAVVELMEAARARGKWCHVGRVNTRRRLWAVTAGGADSVDGTKVGFGNDRNLPQLLDWLGALRTEEFPDHQADRFRRGRGWGHTADRGRGGPGLVYRVVRPQDTRRVVRAATHVATLLDPAVGTGADAGAVAGFRTLMRTVRTAMHQSAAVGVRSSRWPAATDSGGSDGETPARPSQLCLFAAPSPAARVPRPRRRHARAAAPGHTQLLLFDGPRPSVATARTLRRAT